MPSLYHRIIKFVFTLVLFSAFSTHVFCSSLQKLNDQQIQALSSQDGFVIINFWATWCAPCRAEIPMLNRLNKKYPTVEIIGINVDDPENRGAIPGFLKKFPIQYKIFLREGKAFEKLARTFHPQWKAGVPATFVYRNGTRIFFKLGPFEEKELFSALQRQNN